MAKGAKKGKTPREFVTLECQAKKEDGTKCAYRFYVTSKNKRNTKDRLEITKFCPKCRKQTPHKEVK
ncbi:MAG: 50S ribosomal protein L33 [Candidatus Gracilibacteria bacterium]|nr:50S ribosomal protein L33 [Candidatus Gracilibacteria bacterium]